MKVKFAGKCGAHLNTTWGGGHSVPAYQPWNGSPTHFWSGSGGVGRQLNTTTCHNLITTLLAQLINKEKLKENTHNGNRHYTPWTNLNTVCLLFDIVCMCTRPYVCKYVRRGVGGGGGVGRESQRSYQGCAGPSKPFWVHITEWQRVLCIVQLLKQPPPPCPQYTQEQLTDLKQGWALTQSMLSPQKKRGGKKGQNVKTLSVKFTTLKTKRKRKTIRSPPKKKKKEKIFLKGEANSHTWNTTESQHFALEAKLYM